MGIVGVQEKNKAEGSNKNVWGGGLLIIDGGKVGMPCPCSGGRIMDFA